MNTSVSPELAKLLKEKGLRVLPAFESSYPTISDVIMWLYETHKIWIGVYEYKDHAADSNDPFVFRNSVTGLKEFKTPTEAYEAAIEFVLNNRLTSQTK